MDEGLENKPYLLCGCMPFSWRLRQQSSKAPCARDAVIGPGQTPVTPGLASELLLSDGAQFATTDHVTGAAIPQHETPTELRLRKLQNAQPKTDLFSRVASLEATLGSRVQPLVPFDTAPPADGICKYASAHPSHISNAAEHLTFDQIPTPPISLDTDDISTSPVYPTAPLLQPQSCTQPNHPPDGATARVIHLASYRRASSFGITTRKPSLLSRPQVLPVADRPPNGALPQAPSVTGSSALAQSNTGVMELSSAQLLPALHSDAVGAAFPPQAAPSAPQGRRMSFGRISIGLPHPVSGVGSAPNTLTVTGILGGPGQQRDIMLSSITTCDSMGALSLGGAAACVGAGGAASFGPRGVAGGAASTSGGGQVEGGAVAGGMGGSVGGEGLLGLSGELPRFSSLQGGGLSYLLNGDTGGISTSAVEQLRQQVVHEHAQGGLAGQPIEVDNLEQVGQGSFGVVYRGVWQGAAVAIKYLVASSTQQLQISATEALLSKLLAHPNVVQTFACKVVKLTSVYFACPETSLAYDQDGSDYTSDDDGGCAFAHMGAGAKRLLGGDARGAIAAGAPSCTQPRADGEINVSMGGPCACISKCGSTCSNPRQQHVRSAAVGPHKQLNGCTKARLASCSTQSAAAAQHKQQQQGEEPCTAKRSSSNNGNGSGSGPGPPPGPVQPISATVEVVAVMGAGVVGPSCPPPPTAATTACPGVPPGPRADLTAARVTVDMHRAGQPPSPPVHGCCCCGGERSHSGMRPEEDAQRPKGQVLAPARSSSAAGVVSALEPGGRTLPSPDAIAWAGRGRLAAAGRCLDATHASPAPAAAAAAGGDESPRGPPLRPGLRGLLHAAAAETGFGLDSFHSGDGFGAPYLGDECTSRPAPLVLSKYQELLGQVRAQPGDFLTQIIMEYCDRGSLQRAIDKQLFRASSRWSARVALRAMLRTAREVAQGMCHLHASQIVHGDLKPANVLLKSSRSDRRGFVAKVADFGLSKILHLADHSSLDCGSEATGTLAYMAPEVLEGSLSPAADVYSFGVILWQLATSERPFADVHPGHLFMGVSGGTLRLDWPAETHPMVRELGEACLAFEKRRRPSFTEIARALGIIEAAVRNEGAVQAAAAAAAAAAVAPPPHLRETYGGVGLQGAYGGPSAAAAAAALMAPMLTLISGSGTGEATGPMPSSAPAPQMLKHVMIPPSLALLEGHPAAGAMQIPPATPPFIHLHMRTQLLASSTHPGNGAASTDGGSGTCSTGGSMGTHHSANAQGCMALYGVAPATVATANGAPLFGRGHRSYSSYGPLAPPACGAGSDGAEATGGKLGCLAGAGELLVDGLPAPALQVSSSHQKIDPDCAGGTAGGGGGNNNTAGGGRPQLISCTGAVPGCGIGNMVPCDMGLIQASPIMPAGPLISDSMPRGVIAPTAAARTPAPTWSPMDRPPSQPHTGFMQPSLPYHLPYLCQPDPTCQPQQMDAYPYGLHPSAVMFIAPSASASPSCSPQKQHQRPQQVPMRVNWAPSFPPPVQALPAFGASCGGGGDGGMMMGGGGEYVSRGTSVDPIQLQHPHQHTQQQQLLQLQFQVLQQQLLQLQSSAQQQQDPQQQQIYPPFQQQQLAPYQPQQQHDQQQSSQQQQQLQRQNQAQHQPLTIVSDGVPNAQAPPPPPAQTAPPPPPSQVTDGTPIGLMGPPVPLPPSPGGVVWVLPSGVPVFTTACMGGPEPTAVDGSQPPPPLPKHYHLAPRTVAAGIPMYPLAAPNLRPASEPVASGRTLSPLNPEQVPPGPLRTSLQQPVAYLRPYLNGALPYLHGPCLAAGPYPAAPPGKQGDAAAEEDGAAAAAAAVTAPVVNTSPPSNPLAAATDPGPPCPTPAPRLLAHAPYPAAQPYFGTVAPSYFLPCLPYIGPGPARPALTHVVGPAELGSSTEVAATATATLTTTASATATASTTASATATTSPTTATHDGSIVAPTAVPLSGPAAGSSPSPAQDEMDGTLPKHISTPTTTATTTATTTSQPRLSPSPLSRAAGSPPKSDCWLTSAVFNRSPGHTSPQWGTLPNATTTTTTAIGSTAATGGLRAAIPFPPPGQAIDLRPVLNTASVNGCGYASQTCSSSPTGSTTAASLASVAASAGESYGLYQLPYGMVPSNSPMPHRDRECGRWAAPGLRRDAIMEGDEEGL